MAINLLGGVPQLGFGNQNTSGSSQSVGNASSNVLGQLATARNNYANSGFPASTTAPMGVTATTPTSNVTAPSNTIPKAQQNPVTPPSNTPSYSSTSANTPSTSGTSGSLPPAPTSPFAQYSFQQNNPTQNPYTGSTAGNPTQPNNTYLPINSNGQQTGLLGQAYSQAPTFGGVAGQLANTAGQGSPTAQGYAAQTAQYGAGNIPIGQQAQSIANDYGQKIANVGQQGAQFEAGQRTTGTSPIAEGNAAITAQTTAAQQQALATGEGAALQGIGYQLTGQNQAANATNESAGQANVGQQNMQSGLNQAGGLLQPTQVPYSNQYINPTTGLPVNPQAGANEQSAVQLEAGKVRNNQETLSQAETNLGSYSQQGLNDLNQALGSGFNANANAGAAAGQASVAGAPGAAQASNITSAGTASTNSWNGIMSTANTSAATYAQQQAAIRSVGGQALGLMQNDPAINHFAAQFGNQAINKLQSQLSNPQYAAFNTAIQSLQARIGAALQAGEIPTSATQNAQSIANGNISLNALGSTLNQVDTELSSFVDTQNSLANYAKQQAQGGIGNTSNTNSNASSNYNW